MDPPGSESLVARLLYNPTRNDRRSAVTKSRAGRDLKELVVLLQIALGHDRQLGFGQPFERRVDVIDVDGYGPSAVASVEQGIGVVDVYLSLHQGRANLNVGLRISGEFDANDVDLKVRETGEIEQLLTAIVVAENNTGDSTIDCVDNAHRDHAQIVSLQMPQQIVEQSDTILEKHAELPQTGPIPST